MAFLTEHDMLEMVRSEPFTAGIAHSFSCVASNLDGSIDPDVVWKMKAQPGAVAGHAAWDFYGRVWYDGEAFHEQVWRYHAPIAQYVSAYLTALIDHVNANHGYN